MAITKVYTNDRNLDYIQDNIINAIKQTQDIPILKGGLIDVVLVVGVNTVNHFFSKRLTGFIIVNRTVFGDIILVSSTETAMTLNAETAGTYKLWVF